MRRSKLEYHGMRHTKTYKTWESMITRCHSPKGLLNPIYGGKGVVVCERWRNSFIAFYEDMGERPEGMSLDRIDSSGNYEPSNCRWATIQQQNLNRVFKDRPYPNGVHLCKQNQRYKVSIRLNGKQNHLGYFEDLNDAIRARRDAEKTARIV